MLEICSLRDQMNQKIGGKNSRTAEAMKKMLEKKPEHIEAHAKQTQILHNPIDPFLSNWFEKRQGKKAIGTFKIETGQP